MKRLYLESTKPLTYLQIRERREKIQYEKSKFYVNRFPSDVYIRDRSGLITKIKPTVGGSAFKPDRLYIGEYIVCTPDLSNSYELQSRQTPQSMRSYIHKVVQDKWSAEPPIRDRYSIEAFTSLELSTICDNDGVVYLEDHDIVVMYGLNEQHIESIYHPYSLAGYTVNSSQHVRHNNPYIRKGDFTFNIRIVDNHDQFGSRWILIDDKPFCIVACKDEECTDGIYITYSENTLNGKGPQELMGDRFEFSDGGNLPYYKLYESRQEALLARRGIQIEEANARIRELESKATSSENALRKAQQERENLEREAEVRNEKYKQDMHKFEREKEKLESEHKLFMQRQIGDAIAMKRKNTTELIKCVPAILSTVAVAMTLFKKKESVKSK